MAGRTPTKKLIFIASCLGLSWLGMQAVHELGHVGGAFVSGGTVTKVILHPLAISRTDVSPNPNRLLVVWAGPLLGCLLPLAISFSIPNRLLVASKLARFFAGFCLIANGAYIGIGSFEKIGDSGEMLRAGSPLWLLLLFGAVATIAGLWVWHRMGSIGSFWESDEHPSDTATYLGIVALASVVALEIGLSPV